MKYYIKLPQSANDWQELVRCIIMNCIVEYNEYYIDRFTMFWRVVHVQVTYISKQAC